MNPRSFTPLWRISRSSRRSTAWWKVACESANAMWWTAPGSVDVRVGSGVRSSFVKIVISRPSPGSKYRWLSSSLSRLGCSKTNGIPRTPSQKSIDVRRSAPTIVMWWTAWLWSFRTALFRATLHPLGRHMSAGWVFLPALGAPLAHAPVLRFDLLRAWRRPIGGRLFGANKTWRGAVMMHGGTFAAALALHRVPAYRRRLPAAVEDAGPVVTGGLLGAAIWLGELPNSFVKRRLGIAPGKQRRSALGLVISIYDQADWVPVAALLLRPVWRMSARDVAQVFVLVAAVHVPVNLVGYAIGARTAPR